MHMDPITEAIAHFIGLFSTAVEDARVRLDYQEFDAHEDELAEDPDLLNININVISPYLLGEFNPRVPYTPPNIDVFKREVGTTVEYWPMPVSLSDIAISATFAYIFPQGYSLIAEPIIPEFPPLGSSAVYLKQQASLLDNDYLSIGDHGLVFNPVADIETVMSALLQDAAKFQLFSNMDEPGSTSEIGDFIMHAPHLADAFVAQVADNPDVFIARDENLEGQFVNGESVETLPVLADYLPASEEDAPEEASNAQAVALGQGTYVAEAKIDIEAGGNTLVNEAVLADNWYGAPVIAVAGDYVHFDAITQLNVWSDHDATGALMAGWKGQADAPTQGFNVASFKTLSNPSGYAQAASAEGSSFPSNWLVSRLDGDLLFSNWIKQITFVQDNDVTIMSATGTSTMVTIGANFSINAASLTELGLYYDLIIVGGNIYDANIISQMNLLLDDDLIGAVAGFETSGQGMLSTSSNLLWNEALITQTGAMNFQAMPAAYQEASQKLANGKANAPEGVLKDSSFMGLETLQVLYVSGSIFDLQYISQINILGDSDQVALAMNDAKTHVDADWTITTGSNALINFASITDAGVDSTAYVAGGVYSDELLVQAELISDGPGLYGQNPDALVNEAVAFLSDDLIAPETGDGEAEHIINDSDPGSADLLQTMLS